MTTPDPRKTRRLPASPKTSHATKGERTRQKVLESAIQHFTEFGFSGASIKDIMAACGLTQGGFYSHFESKEALYIETVRTLLSQERSKYNRAPVTAPPAERLGAFLNWMRDSLAGDRPLGRQFIWMVLEPDIQITQHVIDEVFHSTYDELRELLSLLGLKVSPDIVASSFLAIALLHEQITARIMRPLAADSSSNLDTAEVLEAILRL